MAQLTPEALPTRERFSKSMLHPASACSTPSLVAATGNPIAGPAKDSAGTLSRHDERWRRDIRNFIRVQRQHSRIIPALRSRVELGRSQSLCRSHPRQAYGNLYDTANLGGSGSGGTLFGLSLNTQGTYSVLNSFTSSGGINPAAFLWILLTIFTESTSNGGGSQFGTVYKFAVSARITAPTDHTLLSGSTVDFSWMPESEATSYQIWLGSTPGNGLHRLRWDQRNQR